MRKIRHTVTDRVGKRFGKLLVLDIIRRETYKYQGYLYLCKCDCGEEFTLTYRTLIKGINKNCDCYVKPKRKSSLKGIPRIWDEERLRPLRKLLLSRKATNWDWVVKEYSKFNKENKELLQSIAYINKMEKPYMKRGGYRGPYKK